MGEDFKLGQHEAKLDEISKNVKRIMRLLELQNGRIRKLEIKWGGLAAVVAFVIFAIGAVKVLL